MTMYSHLLCPTQFLVFASGVDLVNGVVDVLEHLWVGAGLFDQLGGAL